MTSVGLHPSPINQLLEQRYCKLALPITGAEISQVMEAFSKFLEEPEEVKRQIAFSINPSHRRGDIGYVHRDSNDDIYNDDKEYFHYHPGIDKRYPDLLAENPTVARFCDLAKPIWIAARDRTKAFLSEHADTFNQIHEGIFDTEEPHIQLRFLRYFYQNPGRHLARGHYDAGSCTLAIAESDPGLRIGADEKHLEPVEHRDGEGIFMMGRNFPITANPKFLPSWHDVIQLGETIETRSFSRWALVSFFSVTGMSTVSRDKTHNPTLS